MMMLYSIMTMLTLNFMWLNHPVSMGLIIIMQTLMVALIVGLHLSSFFFSYIIMIIMISGMLVLFIYMASMASNEKFYMSMKMMILSVMIILMGIFMQTNYMNNEMKLVLTSISTEKLSLHMLFNKMKYITMLMVSYLLFTMMTISFIVNISEGPLRMYKN
uniref:NADH dehydrogenase subunit 6 n=1 Tax=Hygia lativentris TaxID=763191 RepID=UPI002E77403F|nr:NADH dehydrogenase subunit 6 [Hygia lativentris]WPV77647.1 NADH dehydrogenase subunit 6 [Hygia lativentris]